MPRTYSPKIPGEKGNHNLSVSFDQTRKFIGITQFDEDGVSDRVLLSPTQAQKLVRFINQPRKRKRLTTA